MIRHKIKSGLDKSMVLTVSYYDGATVGKIPFGAGIIGGILSYVPGSIEIEFRITCVFKYGMRKGKA